MDCLYLLQSFVKGSLTLFVSHLFEKDALPENQPMLIVIRVISSLRIGHLLAVPFLTLVLAVNRLSVMLNKKYNWKKNERFMAANTIAWIIYIPFVLILNFAHTGIEFFMTLDSFVYDGPLYFKCILAYGGPACEIGAFLCMVGAVICIVVKKRLLGVNCKPSPLEIRLIIQALLISVPISIVSILGLAVGASFSRTAAYYVTWNTLENLVPVVNLAVYVTFNPLAQSHMKKTLLGNKDMAFIRTFSTNKF